MMLPTESEDSFLRMAVRVVTNSGRDVPMAIIVAAMMESGTPIICASAEPLSMSSCAPSTMAAAPSTKPNRFWTTVLAVSSGRSSEASVPCSRLPAIRLSARNATKNSRMTTLCKTESWPLRVNANSTAIAASSKPALKPNCLRVIRQGMQTSDRHMIRPTLAVTEPTALPTAISALPSSAAKTETSISGSVVAKLTTVAPTMNFGMPNASAIHVAASTNQSPPLMIKTSPATKSSRTVKRLEPVKLMAMTILPFPKRALQAFDRTKKDFPHHQPM